MKRRILLLMMTALLSVGAWAENVWTGEVTPGWYQGDGEESAQNHFGVVGFTAERKLTKGDYIVVTATTSNQYYNQIKVCKVSDNGYWAGDVLTTISNYDFSSNSSKLYIPVSDAIVSALSSATSPQYTLYFDGYNYTMTSVDVVYNQGKANLYYNASGEARRYYGGRLLAPHLFAAASVGDIVTIDISRVGNDEDPVVVDTEWGENVKIYNKCPKSVWNPVTSDNEDPEGLAELTTLKVFTAPTTLSLVLTETLLENAKVNGLSLGGGHYNYTSVDLIYKSDVNIASVSTGTVEADKTKALESETVTLTVTPIANYEFGSLTVTDATGAAVSTSGSDGTYTFTMPATAVTVDATFTPTVPTALKTEDIKLTKSQRSPEGDGTVKLYIDGTETNGWDFTIGRPVSSAEFAGIEVKYKEAVNVQMVITYGDNNSYTQSFTAAGGSTNTAYITFDKNKIVKSIKFGRVDTGSDGRIQFQSSSAVRLVGIVGASTYVPTTSLTLTYETLEDGGGNSVTKVPENSEFTIEEGVGHWAGWIFTLPIPTTLYKGVNFNMTSVPENGAIEIVYESNEKQTLKLSEGNNIVNFVHGGNITQIKFNVAGTYRMGECSASNTYLAKVTDAKYATYGAVNDAIDYSATSGLKAYIAHVEDNKVKLTEVSKVPANTAVVLYAETAGTYTLSTATEDTENFDANQLLVSDGTVEGDESTIYVLANDDENGVGFYLLQSGDKLAAGKAYLKVQNGTAQARQFIGFGDDTTGISVIGNGKVTIDNYYDLQGRRVAQPTKGLYVVNGKKVIIK